MQDFVFRKALPGDIAACAHIYDRIIEEQDKGGFVDIAGDHHGNRGSYPENHRRHYYRRA